MDIYSIYRATNIVTNKVYIGFSQNPKKRILRHKVCFKTNDSKFYRAIRKYGWDSFIWEILYQSKLYEHTKCIMENHFILEHDSYGSGYNSTLGGEGVSGLYRIQSIEEKTKRSKSLQGNKNGRGLTGRKLSKQHKDKIGQTNKIKLTGRTLDATHKQKIGESNSGKKREIVVCPHCNKAGGKPAMYRFHFSNCSSSTPPV